MDNLIRFETFQAVTFALSASLFFYMGIALISWFIKEIKPRKPGPLSRYGPWSK